MPVDGDVDMIVCSFIVAQRYEKECGLFGSYNLVVVLYKDKLIPKTTHHIVHLYGEIINKYFSIYLFIQQKVVY